MSDLTGQDEARRALADKLLTISDGDLREYARDSLMGIHPDQNELHRWADLMDEAAELLRAPSQDRGAEEWNYDMEAAPKGQAHRVLVTVPSIHEGEEPIVGEAWYCTEERHEGWWWSGTSPLHWHDSSLSDTNAEPIAWRHLPAPAARPVPADLNEGGGK